MLDNLLHSSYFKRSLKSGIYVDFLAKKLSLYFLHNQFNWAATFILEKFVIEYLSKHLITTLTLCSSKSSQYNTFNYFFIAYILIILALL